MDSNTRVQINIAVAKPYKVGFHTRCIEYDTTMTDIILSAINEFMITHPPKDSHKKVIT